MAPRGFQWWSLASASLLLDDLLLLDFLVLERLELLVSRLDALAGAGLEAVEELLVRVFECVLVVVLELPGLTDRVEDALVLELDVLEELLLEPADVDDRNRVELAGGGRPDGDDLLLDRERRVLALLEHLHEALAAGELGLGRGVEVGREHRERLHGAVLGQLDLERTGD